MARKRHCKTCRCGVRLKRHVCASCGTRKLEKFMVKTGTVDAFNKQPTWKCRDRGRCLRNHNYGQSGYLVPAAPPKKTRVRTPQKRG